MIWKKDHFANALIAKKAPLNYYEDILVFSDTIKNCIYIFLKYDYNTFFNDKINNLSINNKVILCAVQCETCIKIINELCKYIICYYKRNNQNQK